MVAPRKGGRDSRSPVVQAWALGPDLAAPSLGTHVGTLHLRDSLYQRIQGAGPVEALPLRQSLGPFLAPDSFLLGFFRPESRLPEATGLGPGAHNTEPIPLWEQLTRSWRHELDPQALSACLA